MSCGNIPGGSNCLPCGSDDPSCVSVNPTLAPATCSPDAATRAEGPPGLQGETGPTPSFVIGTVTEGEASAQLVENTPIDYTLNLTIPQPPIDSPNTWTAKQTYDVQAEFKLGIETTGGTSTFGGTAFTVTPDADFGADLNVDGNVTIGGTLHVEQNTDITGNISVAGATFLANTTILGEITFDPAATIIVDPAAAGSFPRGYLVLDSCNKPSIVPNRGSDLYQKEDAIDIAGVVAGDSGPIGGFIVTVPASGCLPQVTPVVTVMARIGYNFVNVPTGKLTVRLWDGGVGTGTKIDEFVQGDLAFTNSAGGCIVLEGQGTLQLGGNGFFLEVVNSTDQDFQPTQITFWATNK